MKFEQKTTAKGKTHGNDTPTLGTCQKYTKSSGLLDSVPASNESRKYIGNMSLSTGGYKPPMKFFACLSFVSSSITFGVSTFCRRLLRTVA